MNPWEMQPRNGRPQAAAQVGDETARARAKYQPVELDPQKQILCVCGCGDFEPIIHAFRVPSMTVGEKSVAVAQTTVCKKCGAQIKFETAPTRKEIEAEANSPTGINP